MKKRLLLTSAGGLTGIFLTKYFVNFPDIDIYCVDISHDNPLKKWTNNVFISPPINSIEYPSFIKEFIINNAIDMIIPITSFDVEFYSKKSNHELFNNAKMIVIEEDINNVLSNKELCYSFLQSIGISTPKVYDEGSIEFPCFIKPIIGSGSKYSLKIDDQDELLFWTNKWKYSIIIEYLDGKEYTVDCLFNYDGKCVGYNTRERIKTVSGGATITQNVNIEGISQIIKILEDFGKIIGPINFQFKFVDNKIVIFDFNTRLASGGLPLTIHSGFDIPRMMINILLGNKVFNYCSSLEKFGKKMIRYYEEYFTNE